MSGRNAGVRAFAAGVLTACAALSLPAGLEPVSPVGGQTVPLVPAEQKRVMAPPTLAARLELVKSDKTLKDEGLLWQRALPLVLKVGATDGEKGPWKVEIDRHENETDWESTFYPGIPDGDPRNTWCRESHFNDGFGRYGDADTPWNDRVVLYLKDCGVTDAEIEAFRRIMLADGEGE